MDPTNTNTPGAGAVIKTAQEAVAPHQLDADQLYAVRDSHGALVPLDLSAFRTKPDRRRGRFHFATVESLVDYVGRFKNDTTTLWVHPTQGKVVAVLDDHDPANPAWREHVAQLDLVVTEEWKLWTAGDGEWFKQQDFAERLQDGLPDIAEPDAAELLEIASTLQGTTEAKWRSGVKLSNGAVTMKYDESIEAKAGAKGDLTVPEVFKLAISPFLGLEPVAVTARLRWRLINGEILLGYKLERPDEVVNDALDRIVERLSDRFEDRVYRGEPARTKDLT